jgi:hypothetical protein
VNPVFIDFEQFQPPCGSLDLTGGRRVEYHRRPQLFIPKRDKGQCRVRQRENRQSILVQSRTTHGFEQIVLERRHVTNVPQMPLSTFGAGDKVHHPAETV